MRLALALVTTASLFSAIGGVKAEDAPPPMENQILRVADGRIITPTELIDDLLQHRFIILGERHGRANHQNREAFILGALADRGRYPGVAFEMIRPSQEEVIAAYRARQPEYAMGLGATLDWGKSTWPSWSFYAPVFQVAFAAKLPIYGAELEGVPLAGEPPSDILASWVASLDKSHCGFADPTRLKELAKLQWSRDLAMAEALVKADTGEGAILIAGNAHARENRSVPRHLAERDVAIVSFIGTDETKKTDMDDLKQTTDIHSFSYKWYTRPDNAGDPCEVFNMQAGSARP